LLGGKNASRHGPSPKKSADPGFLSALKGKSSVADGENDSPTSMSEDDDSDSIVHVEKVPSLVSDDFINYQAHEAASKGIHWRKPKTQQNR
jgi:hypothetical protein